MIDDDALRTPDDATLELTTAAADRMSVVIEMAVDFDRRPGSVDDRPPHQVGVAHEFTLDRLHHLVWANTIDARQPDAAHWWLVDAAVAIGASIVGEGSGPGDVTVPDLGPVWLDGGPIRYTEPIDGVPVVAAVQIEQGRLRTATTNATDADLATDQLAAVTHTGGSARIIAPAGSGKTRVLTERARHVVTAWNLPVASVSVVAFNKRA
ncbi:MAG: UvrD-helicase domain-containing protein, partial [Ilumatobacteraceae bacterium]